MTRKLAIVTLPIVALAICWATPGVADESFVRLAPLGNPKIVAAAEVFPGFSADNLLDGVPVTEYASNGKGTDTFVEFDFGVPVTIGAFRHVNRNDPALVAASELTIYRRGRHRGGNDCRSARGPARRRDHVCTAQAGHRPAGPLASHQNGQRRDSCVGGSEIALFQGRARRSRRRTASASTPSAKVVVDRKEGRLVQPLVVVLDYPYMHADRGRAARRGARAPSPCD